MLELLPEPPPSKDSVSHMSSGLSLTSALLLSHSHFNALTRTLGGRAGTKGWGA